MIYAILDKSKNLIYFTTFPRSEEEQEHTELLYTSDIKTLEDIEQDLRPWIYLLDNSGNYYKNVPEIGEYMTGKLKAEQYTRIYSSEIKSEIEEFMKDYSILVNLSIVPGGLKINYSEIPELLYDCDLYNYLESVFGSAVSEFVFSYKLLGRDEKQFLSEFIKQSTKDKKLGYLRNNIDKISSSVIEFLPLWYRLGLRVVGNRESSEVPEYKNLDLIGGDIDINSILKDRFFDVFKLGNIYTGQEVKDKIQTIYNELGILKTPKISDLLEYFEVTSVSLKSSYRIDLRK